MESLVCYLVWLCCCVYCRCARYAGSIVSIPFDVGSAVNSIALRRDDGYGFGTVNYSQPGRYVCLDSGMNGFVLVVVSCHCQRIDTNTYPCLVPHSFPSWYRQSQEFDNTETHGNSGPVIECRL